ncbi:MAG TPA: chromate efflux transporter [Vicinamibacterales bacterium]
MSPDSPPDARPAVTRSPESHPLAEVARLFLRLGCTAFGGPAAHVALMERECVQRRGWITREEFLDLLGVANLIPGPTSTELAMHVGRRRAGWAGLVVAGLAFIVPGAVFVGVLAALYQRGGQLPVARGVADAVQPVVIVLVLQALVPLGRSALRSVPMVMVAIAVALMAAVGIPEIRILLFAGVAHMIVGRTGAPAVTVILLLTTATLAAASAAAPVPLGDLAAYFLRTGSLLFGSGYVLLPVLEGDLVQRYGWLTREQLLDAIAAGQATPGPVFTTATFIGYLLGGPWAAVVATVAMFLPAFIFSALSSVMLERLSRSRLARAFLEGVNAAAVALIAVVLIRLAAAAFTGPVSIVLAVLAAVAILYAGINASLVLLLAAGLGALVAALA